MVKLGRRQTITLGAAAAVVGPSVWFSRPAHAGTKAPANALRAGSFKVEIEGYKMLPGVLAVDLGGIKFGGKMKPAYELVTLELGSKSDAPKLTSRFAQVTGKAWKLPSKSAGAKMKISVSLWGAGAKKPALTYHALEAAPHSIVADKYGRQTLKWKIGGMTTTGGAQRHAGKLASLPKTAFKAEVDGQSLPVQQLMKYSYAHSELTQVKLDPVKRGGKIWTAKTTVKTELRGYKLAPPVGGGKSSKLDAQAYKLDAVGLRKGNQLVLTTFVTGYKMSPSSIVLRATAGKHTSVQDKWGEHGVKIDIVDPSSGKRRLGFAKVELASVQFPKLEAGSNALVTETFHFKLESGG